MNASKSQHWRKNEIKFKNNESIWIDKNYHPVWLSTSFCTVVWRITTAANCLVCIALSSKIKFPIAHTPYFLFRKQSNRTSLKKNELDTILRRTDNENSALKFIRAEILRLWRTTKNIEIHMWWGSRRTFSTCVAIVSKWWIVILFIFNSVIQRETHWMK